MTYRHRDIIRSYSRVNIPGVHPFVREQLEYVASVLRWAVPQLAPDLDHDVLTDIVSECDAIIANLHAHSRNPLVLHYIERDLDYPLTFIRRFASDDNAAEWARARANGEL